MNIHAHVAAPAEQFFSNLQVEVVEGDGRGYAWFRGACHARRLVEAGAIPKPDAIDRLLVIADRAFLTNDFGTEAVEQDLALAFRPTPDPQPSDDDDHQDDHGDDGVRYRPGRPAASTVSAFLWLAAYGTAVELTEWLARHPGDAPELQKIWERKCSAARK